MIQEVGSTRSSRPTATGASTARGSGSSLKEADRRRRDDRRQRGRPRARAGRRPPRPGRRARERALGRPRRRAARRMRDGTYRVAARPAPPGPLGACRATSASTRRRPSRASSRSARRSTSPAARAAAAPRRQARLIRSPRPAAGPRSTSGARRRGPPRDRARRAAAPRTARGARRGDGTRRGRRVAPGTFVVVVRSRDQAGNIGSSVPEPPRRGARAPAARPRRDLRPLPGRAAAAAAGRRGPPAPVAVDARGQTFNWSLRRVGEPRRGAQPAREAAARSCATRRTASAACSCSRRARGPGDAACRRRDDRRNRACSSCCRRRPGTAATRSTTTATGWRTRSTWACPCAWSACSPRACRAASTKRGAAARPPRPPGLPLRPHHRRRARGRPRPEARGPPRRAARRRRGLADRGRPPLLRAFVAQGGTLASMGTGSLRSEVARPRDGARPVAAGAGRPLRRAPGPVRRDGRPGDPRRRPAVQLFAGEEGLFPAVEAWEATRRRPRGRPSPPR